MSLTLELALDRIEAELAAELPPHMRAFARAHAAGAPVPPAPAVLADPATLATAERARAEPALAARGRVLWRLTALHAIAREVGVTDAADWDALGAQARAREAAARRRWGRGFLAIADDVHEVGAVPDAPEADVAPVAPEAAEPISPAAVAALWQGLTRLAAPAIVLAPARARTFAVRPGEAIVVVRADATVGAWSQVAHELGHAWVAIAGLDLPRALDEAVAMTAARTLERTYPGARALHARQHAIARRLAATERALYAGEAVTRDTPPPWALVHDPGAQAAYVVAHHRAWTVDRLDDLRPLLP